MRLTNIYRQDNLVFLTFGSNMGASDATVSVSCGNRQEAIILEGVLETVWRVVPMDDVSITLPPPPVVRDANSLTDEQFGKVVRAYKVNGPINAIKVIREFTKWGLKDSKDWFDQYVR